MAGAEQLGAGDAVIVADPAREGHDLGLAEAGGGAFPLHQRGGDVGELAAEHGVGGDGPHQVEAGGFERPCRQPGPAPEFPAGQRRGGGEHPEAFLVAFGGGAEGDAAAGVGGQAHGEGGRGHEGDLDGGLGGEGAVADGQDHGHGAAGAFRGQDPQGAFPAGAAEDDPVGGQQGRVAADRRQAQQVRRIGVREADGHFVGALAGGDGQGGRRAERGGVVDVGDHQGEGEPFGGGPVGRLDDHLVGTDRGVARAAGEAGG